MTQPASPTPTGDRKPSVALFVDFETLRFGLEDNFGVSREGLQLGAPLKGIAERYGHLVMANAYGDWTSDQPIARDFRRVQIQPKLVPPSHGPHHRPDITMSLDALETLLAGDGIEIYVLATGDDDFIELADRLRRAQRRVVVCGLEAQVSQALVEGVDEFIPLEGILDLKSKPAAKKIDFSMFDWAPFISLVAELEKKDPVVDATWLQKKKLTQENSGCKTSAEKQQLLDRAVEEGIIVLSEVERPDKPGEKMTACKLNRTNPLVCEFSGE